MFELIPYLPLPLLILMVLLVIIPTAISIAIRIKLHRFYKENLLRVSRLLTNTQERGIQPRFLQQLEDRYRVTGQQIEQVNTVALIDSIFTDEILSVLGLKLHCEQAEHFCRTLPNLLLAFGLLGTFWGITSNLYKVGRAIQNLNQSGTDINQLIQELQPQLQGMSIAFLTSLIALFCSSVLIIFNAKFNTELVKYRLVNALEDYLDNIFRPLAQGDTRLDRAIDRMVTQQHEFLVRFHDNVGQVLEETFGRAAHQIAQETHKINHLAQQVYTGFAQSAKLIVEGSESFKASTQQFTAQTQTIVRLMPQFKKDAEMISAGAESFKSIADQIEGSQFFEKMAGIVDHSSQIYSSFAESSETLSQATLGLVSQTETITTLAKQVYENLDEFSSQIRESSSDFQEAAALINNSSLASKFSSAVNQWGEIQNNFATSTQAFGENAQTIKPLLQEMTQATQNITSVGQNMTLLSQSAFDLNSSSHKLFLDQNQQLQELQIKLLSVIESLETQVHNSQSAADMLAQTWSQNAADQLQIYSSQFNDYLSQLKSQVVETQSQNQSLVMLVDSMQTWGKEYIQVEGERSTVLVELSQEIQQLNNLLSRFKLTDVATRTNTASVSLNSLDSDSGPEI